jgi:hypothetical protein
MNDNAHEACEAFIKYTQAFQSLDPKAVGQHFHVPAIMATEQNVQVFNSAADVERAYGQVMAELPAIGYAKSEFSNLRVRQLSENMAIVTAVCIWKKADGQELQRFGVTYTLRRTGGTWKNLCALIHAPQVYD